MTILTGIKPTGTLHLGNYVGAIAPLIDLASHSDDQVFALVADLHALNYVKDPSVLGAQSLACSAALMAFDKTDQLLLYRSSRVAEIGQIMAVLANHMAKGYLNRAHAYKAARQANEEAGRPVDAGVNTGLYLYPLLMASDMFAAKATKVPVGADQIQHLEIAQEIARSFNSRYGAVLTVPEAISQADAMLPGLDGRKMSKSYENIIPLFGPDRANLLRKVATDSRALEDPKDPDECSLFGIYRHFASASEVAALAARYRQGGFGYGEIKQLLVDAVETRLCDAESRYGELMQEPDLVRQRLELGEAAMRERAYVVLQHMLTVLGILPRAECLRTGRYSSYMITLTDPTFLAQLHTNAHAFNEAQYLDLAATLAVTEDTGERYVAYHCVNGPTLVSLHDDLQDAINEIDDHARRFGNGIDDVYAHGMGGSTMSGVLDRKSAEIVRLHSSVIEVGRVKLEVGAIAE